MRSARSVAVVVVTHTVLIQIVTYASRPTLAYAAIDAGGLLALLGVMSAVFAVPALFLAIPAGRLVDTAGERLLAVSGSTLVIMSLVVALIFPGSLVALLGATLLLGVGHLGCIVAQQTLVANRAQTGRRDSAFGWYTLAASAGQTVGPLLLAVPGEDPLQPPVALIMFVCLCLAAVMLCSSVAFPEVDAEALTPRGSTTGAWQAAARNIRQRGTFRALLASGISLASVDITLVYWPALGSERHLAPWIISVMLVARALATMASRGMLGSATRRWGRRHVMVGSLALAAAALAVTALPVHESVLIGAAVLYGVGIGACQPITMSWLTALVAPGQRGGMLSLRLVGNRFAQSTVPALAGFLAAPLGAAGVIVVLGLSLAVATWAGAAVPATEED